MTDSKLRQKYSYVMDWRVQVLFNTFNTALSVAVPIYLRSGDETDDTSTAQPYSSSCRSAFAPWQLWAGTILVCIAVWCLFLKKLYRRDTLSMSSEIIRTVAAFILSYTPLITLVALMDKGVLEYDSRVQLLVIPWTVCVIIDINVLSRHAWGVLEQNSSRKSLWSSRSSAAVHSSADDDRLDVVQDPTQLNTSLAIMQSPTLCTAYAAFVEKSLCYESFKFLVDATAYAKETYESASAQVSVFCYSYV
jgi:hypothetical protein